MKQATKDTIAAEAEAFIRRIIAASATRPLTGSFRFEVHLSQSGFSGMEATFTERLK